MNANVDHKEIAKFEAMAESWWDLNGSFKPLHLLNPLRLDYIQRKAGSLFGQTVIDIGCGGGILSESMAKEGANVTGLDMGHEPLQIAKLHALESGVSVNYVQETVEAHAEQFPQHYDVVTCMEMLEHVPDPASVIQACAKLVKPEGHLIFSTINRNPKSWLLMIAGAEYLTRIVPKGTHEFDKFIRPSELISWMEAAGIAIQNIVGVHYNPLSETFKSVTDVSVNYMVYAKLKQD